MIQRDIEYSGQFSKDVKLAQKRHKDMNKLKYLMTLLINNTLPLPMKFVNPAPTGLRKTLLVIM
ncbi:type II toxin-antitoxin system mRNA interferase toxin, RelE/StbE family [Escherichia coli]|nr:type II toxin-antitoxin system mRNA interferase toxin, RelE/StbE family [Escherichia coli]